MFLGITGPSFCFSPDAFNPPSKRIDKMAPDKFRTRLSLNFAFFISNYALVTAGVFLVVALTHPGMLLHVGGLLCFWYLHFLASANESLLVIYNRDFGNILPPSRRTLILNIMSAWVILFDCLGPFLSAVTISTVIILFHASMRDPKHVEKSGAFHRRVDSDDEGTETDDEVIVNRSDAL